MSYSNTGSTEYNNNILFLSLTSSLDTVTCEWFKESASRSVMIHTRMLNCGQAKQWAETYARNRRRYKNVINLQEQRPWSTLILALVLEYSVFFVRIDQSELPQEQELRGRKILKEFSCIKNQETCNREMPGMNAKTWTLKVHYCFYRNRVRRGNIYSFFLTWIVFDFKDKKINSEK